MRQTLDIPLHKSWPPSTAFGVGLPGTAAQGTHLFTLHRSSTLLSASRTAASLRICTGGDMAATSWPRSFPEATQSATRRCRASMAQWPAWAPAALSSDTGKCTCLGGRNSTNKVPTNLNQPLLPSEHAVGSEGSTAPHDAADTATPVLSSEIIWVCAHHDIRPA